MVTVHIGQDAVLPCEVKGDSSPVVMWRKDGFPVRQDNNKYVLRFLTGVCNCIRHTRLYLSNTDAVYPQLIHLSCISDTPYYPRARCAYMQLSWITLVATTAPRPTRLAQITEEWIFVCLVKTVYAVLSLWRFWGCQQIQFLAQFFIVITA